MPRMPSYATSTAVGATPVLVWPQALPRLRRQPPVQGFCDVGLGRADHVGSPGCLRAHGAPLPVSPVMAATNVVGSCTPVQAVAAMPQQNPPAWSLVIASR